MTKHSIFYLVGWFLMLIVFSTGLASTHQTRKVIKYEELGTVNDPNLQVVDQRRIFEVRLILDSKQRTPTSLRLKGKTAYCYLDDKVQLSLEDVDSVSVAKSSVTRSYHLLIYLTPNGREKFAVFTGANIKKQMGVIINNRLMDAPYIQNKILGGHMSVTGVKTLKEAEALAQLINNAQGKAGK